MEYKYKRSKYKSIQNILTKVDCIYTFTRSAIDEKYVYIQKTIEKERPLKK